MDSPSAKQPPALDLSRVNHDSIEAVDQTLLSEYAWALSQPEVQEWMRDPQVKLHITRAYPDESNRAAKVARYVADTACLYASAEYMERIYDPEYADRYAFMTRTLRLSPELSMTEIGDLARQYKRDMNTLRSAHKNRFTLRQALGLLAVKNRLAEADR